MLKGHEAVWAERQSLQSCFHPLYLKTATKPTNWNGWLEQKHRPLKIGANLTEIAAEWE